MVNEVESRIRRTRQYWFVDGLAEICVGLFFLVLGLIFFGQAYVPGRSTAGTLLQLAFPVFILVGFFVTRRLIHRFKERITYPRTGYVSYPRPSTKRRWLGGIAAAALAAILTQVYVRYRPVPVDWTPFLEGVMAGVLLILAGQGLRRFWWTAGSVVVCGFCLVFVRFNGPEILASAYFYSITGMVLLTSGAITLWKYLQLPAVEDNQ